MNFSYGNFTICIVLYLLNDLLSTAETNHPRLIESQCDGVNRLNIILICMENYYAVNHTYFICQLLLNLKRPNLKTVSMYVK